MSKVTVADNAFTGDDKPDYVLYFDPPLKAYMPHTLDDGTEVKVLADIDAYYVKDNNYSFNYTDPECSACGVCDFCEANELEFVVTHSYGSSTTDS